MKATQYKYSLHKHVLFTILVSVVVGVGVYIYKPKEAEVKYAYPAYTAPVDPTIGIRCESIVGSSIYGSNVHEEGILASVFKGTDKISIQQDGETFKFLTQASFDAGDTGSSENWKIVQNNKNFLIATISRFEEAPIRNYADLFYLNKENGMAMWTKTRATFLGTDTPETQTYLMTCH